MAKTKQGFLRKMSHCLDKDNQVSYYLRLSEGGDSKPEEIALNDLLGQKIKLEFSGEIGCIACGRKVKKTFNQGYCFPCVQTLAECDMCIVKPELCHYDEGTCRDDEFGDEHCNITHSIYLSLTSGVKVGITRSYQEQSRWIDQGAVKAITVMNVQRRKHAGLIEVKLSKEMADKTNWRKMLKNEYDDVDLLKMKEEVLGRIEEIFNTVDSLNGNEELDYIPDEIMMQRQQLGEVQEINYPALEYPEKIKSFNFDKDPNVEGILKAIKGQYLILDNGVINLRKFAGYRVSFSGG